MNALLALGTLVLGLAIRLAIPIAITLIVIWLLREIDAHWQAEAGFTAQPAVIKPLCWKINACPPETREDCPAFHSRRPCWQVHRDADGRLRPACLNCRVFRGAPTPAHLRA